MLAVSSDPCSNGVKTYPDLLAVTFVCSGSSEASLILWGHAHQPCVSHAKQNIICGYKHLLHSSVTFDAQYQ